MNRQNLIIHSKKLLANSIYEMTLLGDCDDIKNPGQFINIKIDGFYLRRPISISDYGSSYLKIIFKAVGEGTKKLASLEAGHVLDVLMALGNGFDVSLSKKSPLIVGGGIGAPPLYGLAKALVSKGQTPHVVLGFNSLEDVILLDEFREIGINPIITTVDGSAGIKGFVTDAMKDITFDYVFSCGPEAMLKAVYEISLDGQFSFEARMACGFGACMGCTCETKYGYKRICKDGPVLFKEEIKW